MKKEYNEQLEGQKVFTYAENEDENSTDNEPKKPKQTTESTTEVIKPTEEKEKNPKKRS